MGAYAEPEYVGPAPESAPTARLREARPSTQGSARTLGSECEWLPQGRVDDCLEFAARFDSFDDRPWSDPRLVAAFADRFPGSRYVLLERDVDSWIGSYRAHFRNLGRPISAPDEELVRLYEDHNRRVVEAVNGKGALLRMNVCAGQGYEVLCPFLGLPVLQEPFPKVNQRSSG